MYLTPGISALIAGHLVKCHRPDRISLSGSWGSFIMFFSLAFLLFPVISTGQTNTDFWFAAPEITSGHADSPIYLRLTSFGQAATVTISEPANTPANFPVITVTISANSSVSVDLTSRKEQVESKPPNTVLNFGLYIHSNVPITAYYEESSYLNPELFTLKGNNALGKSFFIPSQSVYNNHPDLTPDAYTSFDIIASEDNTTVTINPKKPIVGHAAGVPFTVTLNKGQVYSAQATSQLAADHLMGSKVTSDKPVSITVKDDSDRYPGEVAADLTGDQTVPINIIGKDYIIVRGSTNSSVNDWVFVTATENNTVVSVNGTYAATINASNSYQYSMSTTELCSSVSADKPVYLWHVTGYGSEAGSSLLPPISCSGSSQVAFTRTTVYTFQLIILTKAGAQGFFTLDGNPSLVTASMFSPVPGNPLYVYAKITFSSADLPIGAHILVNSQDIFHMGIIHTYDATSAGCAYGYFSDFASLNLGPDQSVCAGTPVTFDAGPNRTSYAWFYNGVPFATGVQTITVNNAGQYSVTVVDHGCTLSDTVLLDNLPAYVPVISGNNNLCQGQSGQLTVTQIFNTYQWSTGATTQAITVNSGGTYWVTVTGSNSCPGSTSFTVTVHPLPSVTLTQPSSVCTTTPPFALTGGSPPGGIYSGTGVNSSTGIFDPSSGAGAHLITYTYTGPYGCIGSDVKTLMVYLPPSVQLADQPSVCISDPPFLLTGGTPSGGIYSGPGVNSATGMFTPSTGAGIYQITYTYSYPNGCAGFDIKTLTVYPLPSVQLAPQSPVCISASPFPLSGGTPSGGVYSGTGVNTSTGYFDPSSGTGSHNIIYTYTNSNGCSNAAIQPLVVYPLPTVTMSGQDGACFNSPPFMLTCGSPLGGIYSGAGVNSSTGYFDPSSGLGMHQITYSYNDLNGCMGIATKVLTVYSAPDVQLQLPPPVCISTPPFVLTGGSPYGGTYSGPGVNSNTGVFDPSSGTGLHTITYSYTDAYGCSGSSTGTMEVRTNPTVQLESQPNVCISVSPFLLSGGMPAGGIYSGPGVTPSTGIFDPSSGAGIHMIVYTYTDNNGCAASDTKGLTVLPLPLVQLASQPQVCITAAPFPLSGGTPSGGSYSGPGINTSTGFFNPASGSGTHLITYSYTDQNGCTGSASRTLTVNPLPVVQMSGQNSTCLADPPFLLTCGSPSGGIYSGTGVNTSTGVFSPSSGAGVHIITYAYTDLNGCSASAYQGLKVIPPPQPSGTITGPASVCESAQHIAYTLNDPDTLATSFTWEISPDTAGDISGTSFTVEISFTPGFSGNAAIRFRPSGNCGTGSYSAYSPIMVHTLPIVTLVPCIDPVTTRGAKPILLKGGRPVNGSYALDGIALPSGILNPATVGTGSNTHLLSYTYTNTHGCTAAATLSLRVNNASVFTCGSVLTDIRDLSTYPTFEVVTGTVHRCWMRKNLNYGSGINSLVPQTDNCLTEKYCPGNDTAMCLEYGGYYQWDELMGYYPDPAASAAGLQGICPPEWHVATEQEWIDLVNYFRGPGMAGWVLIDPYLSGGFHAVPGGIQYQNSSWWFLSANLAASFFWTSIADPAGGNRIITRGLNNINASVSKYASLRNNAFPVRCVKD